MEAWSGISLTATTSTGNLQQIYPTWAPVGVAKASATNGQLILGPSEGYLISLQIETDGINGGIIQIWDLNGDDVGADVSSSNTPAITNAQLVALQALNRAKLIYEQNFVAGGYTPPTSGPRAFQHGLAARFVSSSGVCNLNLSVGGGFRLTEKVG